MNDKGSADAQDNMTETRSLLDFKTIAEGNTPKDSLCLASIDDTSTLWHRRLGHANMRLIQSLSRNLPKLKDENDDNLIDQISFSLGETLLLMERFDFEEMLKTVERFKVTYMPVSPLVVAMAKSEVVMRYKARLVANERSQQQGIDCDETFSPVVKLVTIHIVLSLAVHLHVFTTTQLTAYTDADWAGFPVTRRSTSGYYVFLRDILLSWSAKRQVTLSRYSVEAEYKGLANVVAETAWIHNLLLELHAPLHTATHVYCDNVTAIYLSTNPVQHQRTKHIEIDMHFIRDYVASRQVHVLHILSRFE
ncbi:ribonuclease H-like domain-containing protein [Tanacetum coccineum]